MDKIQINATTLVAESHVMINIKIKTDRTECNIQYKTSVFKSKSEFTYLIISMPMCVYYICCALSVILIYCSATNSATY